MNLALKGLATTVTILLTIVALCLGSLVAFALIVPFVQQQREAQRRAQVKRNLEIIGAALRQYDSRTSAPASPAASIP